MNKQDLIEFVTTKAELTKKDATQVIDAVFDGIIAGLKEGKDARFIGFGSFAVQVSAARKGRNPRTGVEIEIPASKRITFKAGKEFKAVVNS